MKKHKPSHGETEPRPDGADRAAPDLDTPPEPSLGERDDPGVAESVNGADATDTTATTDATDAPDAPDAPDTGTVRADGDQREKYLRLAAEYDNYRRRTTKERQEAGTRAQADLARQLIDGLDDLARFAHVDPSATDATTLVQGVEMIERKMLKALQGAGLEILNPVDQQFDPARHEAVMTEPALSPEDDHVVARVFQSGYMFAGQLLRPARVVVKQWNG